MEHHEEPGGDEVLTLLNVDLDCPWCLRATVEALEADPSVTSVRAHSADSCLEVVHQGSVDGLLRTITSIGHTIEVASNGEAIMAPASANVAHLCSHHDTPSVETISSRPAMT